MVFNSGLSPSMPNADQCWLCLQCIVQDWKSAKLPIIWLLQIVLSLAPGINQTCWHWGIDCWVVDNLKKLGTHWSLLIGNGIHKHNFYWHWWALRHACWPNPLHMLVYKVCEEIYLPLSYTSKLCQLFYHICAVRCVFLANVLLHK